MNKDYDLINYEHMDQKPVEVSCYMKEFVNKNEQTVNVANDK